MKSLKDEDDIDVFDLEIHPLAYAYDMQDEETYFNILQNISINGINDPIAIAKENNEYYIIDGRNRLKAAKELGIVDVPYKIIDMEISEYIYMVHLRRNPSKSQQAIAQAILRPNGEKRGRKGNSSTRLTKSKLQVVDSNGENKTSTKLKKLDHQTLAHARYLIGGDPLKPTYPHLVEDVKKGIKSCRIAYEEAKNFEAINKINQQKLLELKENAYDLYCKVIEDGEDIDKQHRIMLSNAHQMRESRALLYGTLKNVENLLIFSFESQRQEFKENFSNEEFIKATDKTFEEMKKDIVKMIEGLNNLIGDIKC